MSNSSPEMFVTCKSCGHSKIDHYAGSENTEITEAGICLTPECNCQQFVIPVNWIKGVRYRIKGVRYRFPNPLIFLKGVFLTLSKLRISTRPFTYS